MNEVAIAIPTLKERSPHTEARQLNETIEWRLGTLINLVEKPRSAATSTPSAPTASRSAEIGSYLNQGLAAVVEVFRSETEAAIQRVRHFHENALLRIVPGHNNLTETAVLVSILEEFWKTGLIERKQATRTTPARPTLESCLKTGDISEVRKLLLEAPMLPEREEIPVNPPIREGEESLSEIIQNTTGRLKMLLYHMEKNMVRDALPMTQEINNKVIRAIVGLQANLNQTVVSHTELLSQTAPEQREQKLLDIIDLSSVLNRFAIAGIIPPSYNSAAPTLSLDAVGKAALALTQEANFETLGSLAGSLLKVHRAALLTTASKTDHLPHLHPLMLDPMPKDARILGVHENRLSTINNDGIVTDFDLASGYRLGTLKPELGARKSDVSLPIIGSSPYDKRRHVLQDFVGGSVRFQIRELDRTDSFILSMRSVGVAKDFELAAFNFDLDRALVVTHSRVSFIDLDRKFPPLHPKKWLRFREIAGREMAGTAIGGAAVLNADGQNAEFIVLRKDGILMQLNATQGNDRMDLFPVTGVVTDTLIKKLAAPGSLFQVVVCAHKMGWTLKISSKEFAGGDFILCTLTRNGNLPWEAHSITHVGKDSLSSPDEKIIHCKNDGSYFITENKRTLTIYKLQDGSETFKFSPVASLPVPEEETRFDVTIANNGVVLRTEHKSHTPDMLRVRWYDLGTLDSKESTADTVAKEN